MDKKPFFEIHKKFIKPLKESPKLSESDNRNNNFIIKTIFIWNLLGVFLSLIYTGFIYFRLKSVDLDLFNSFSFIQIFIMPSFKIFLIFILLFLLWEGFLIFAHHKWGRNTWELHGFIEHSILFMFILSIWNFPMYVFIYVYGSLESNLESLKIINFEEIDYFIEYGFSMGWLFLIFTITSLVSVFIYGLMFYQRRRKINSFLFIFSKKKDSDRTQILERIKELKKHLRNATSESEEFHLYLEIKSLEDQLEDF